MSTAQQSAGNLTDDQAPALAQRYYSILNPGGSATVLDGLVAEDWKNYSSNGSFTNQQQFAGQVAGLRRIVPDLVWRIDEIIVSGDKMIVRGQGSGTPVAELFGAPVTGRSFAILSIDIHTVRGGRIVETYHLEDWAGALQQLIAG